MPCRANKHNPGRSDCQLFWCGGGHPWSSERVHTCPPIYYRPALRFKSQEPEERQSDDTSAYRRGAACKKKSATREFGSLVFLDPVARIFFFLMQFLVLQRSNTEQEYFTSTVIICTERVHLICKHADEADVSGCFLCGLQQPSRFNETSRVIFLTVCQSRHKK